MIEIEKPEDKLKQAINYPDLVVVSGSTLYGTQTEESDKDERGFTIVPPSYMHSLYNSGGGIYNFETHDESDPVDRQLHSFRKFLKYILKCNNNFIELLFAPADKVISGTIFGHKLVANKRKFLSTKAYRPFRGFAKSEFHKIVGEKTRDLGKKRKKVIKEFGYSLKNAYHSIRILKQGAELLRDGHITFPRPEVDMLMDIRRGEITLEEFKSLYEEATIELDKAMDNTSLPENPDYEFANELIADSMRRSKQRYG